MMNQMRFIFVGLFLTGCLELNSAAALDYSTQQASDKIANEYKFCKGKLKGDIFLRTELYFGLSRNSGPDVTEEEFQRFIDTKVTPRFPDGLTLINAKGQFKDSTGAIIQEGSKLLILLYPFNMESNQSVEQIRTDYKQDFQQESVLRVDEQSCVSF
jgi:hypothetical protein